MAHAARAVAIALTLVAAPMAAAGYSATSGSGANVAVVVRETPGAGSGPEELVEQLGGEVQLQLGIIGGFSAIVPAEAISVLAGHPEIYSVTRDARVQLTGWTDEIRPDPDDLDHRAAAEKGSSEVADEEARRDRTEMAEPGRHEKGRTDEGRADEGRADEGRTDEGSLAVINDRVIRSTTFWKKGYTGTGIDVAIIDSGVAPVEGLTARGKVVNGPDLSFDTTFDNLRYLDLYGHGTHLAGIVAGRDRSVPPIPKPRDFMESFVGVAPGARVINVKVADGSGTADISQVIAAIDWVVQHRNDPGMNIRVLNLAFGTDGLQDYVLDPLAYAVEVAWRRGITVVVAAGNDGNEVRLRNPAYDPFVIAVGAVEAEGTYTTQDDAILSFSNCGTSQRPVDVVAPGKSVISLRVPGSYADTHYPGATVGDRFFRGTGTSQAAAIVSGAVALILDQRPELTPDQVKALLTATAQPIAGLPDNCQGAGLIDLKAAYRAPSPQAVQTWEESTGLGSLEAARGSYHVEHDGVVLVGEQDIFGNAWDGASWSGASWSGASWSGGSWSGASWSGASWSGGEWNGASWSGASWSGASWSGASWSGASWSGASWSGASWSGASWSGASWSGDVWASTGGR